MKPGETLPPPSSTPSETLRLAKRYEGLSAPAALAVAQGLEEIDAPWERFTTGVDTSWIKE